MPTVKGILDERLTLTVESLDRLYLSGYIRGLETETGLVGFLTRRLRICMPAPTSPR